MTARSLPLADTQYVDHDIIALWIFALLRDSEDLLLEYLEQWPRDHKPIARA